MSIHGESRRAGVVGYTPIDAMPQAAPRGWKDGELHPAMARLMDYRGWALIESWTGSRWACHSLHGWHKMPHGCTEAQFMRFVDAGGAFVYGD